MCTLPIPTGTPAVIQQFWANHVKTEFQLSFLALEKALRSIGRMAAGISSFSPAANAKY